jgi:hypothetical protein
MCGVAIQPFVAPLPREPQRSGRAARAIRGLAAARVRYGYFRIQILLRREGWKINHKRVYRLYRQEGSACGLDGRGAT